MAAEQDLSKKTIYRRCLDAINSRDSEAMSVAIDELFDRDLQIRTPMPVQARGAQAIKIVFETLHRAFPDLLVTVEDFIEEGDKLVARQRVTGTQKGEFMGLPPSGRSVTYDEIFVFRFANHRITEMWGVVDSRSLMGQLGLGQEHAA